MKNHFWNMLANIKNGQLARRSFIYQKKKKSCEAILKVLWNEGFIIGYKTSEKHKDITKIFLKYNNGKPVINNIKALTKPGKRVYYSIKQIWKIDPDKTFIIFSTNQGFKTIYSCRKLKLGGEPFVVIN